MLKDSKEVYNDNYKKWVRREPSSLSDFTGRRPLFQQIGNLTNKSILDIGCGEGYCARKYVELGAKKIVAVDFSNDMISAADEANKADGTNIIYEVQDARALNLKKERFDVITAVFVFNYINIAEMTKVMKQVFSHLSEAGRFIFTVPHPSLAFFRNGQKEPFGFELPENSNYFSLRDQETDGVIQKTDGTSLPVRMFHKTFEDYLKALSDAGFSSLPQIKELTLTEELSKEIPDFFSDLKGIPMHVLFEVKK